MGIYAVDGGTPADMLIPSVCHNIWLGLSMGLNCMLVFYCFPCDSWSLSLPHHSLTWTILHLFCFSCCKHTCNVYHNQRNLHYKEHILIMSDSLLHSLVHVHISYKGIPTVSLGVCNSAYTPPPMYGMCRWKYM